MAQKTSSPRSPKSRHPTKKRTHTRPLAPSSIRLNKWIADCGIASRRKADELIEAGKVQVNGKTVYELGVKVDPQKDRITVQGRSTRPIQKHIYIAFNKPENVLTSTSDPSGRPTVMDFFPKISQRIFPVGRLDWDSEGLLLLTSDGEFANLVMSPKANIPKTYLVKLSGRPSQEQLQKLRNGVSIIGGRVKATRVEKVRQGESDKYDWVEISITEGKNRQVRRMFEKIGFDVKKLRRVAIGRLRLGSLKKGAFIHLKAEDLERIFIPLHSSSRPAKVHSKKSRS